MSDHKIRKQVYELSAEDLHEHPIWEFCSDEEDIEGQGEATVRPSRVVNVPGYSPGVYIVAAKVRDATGKIAEGYVYSGESEDLGCIQPNVMVAAGQVNLWLGSLRFLLDPAQVVAAQLARLGGRVSFPISFETVRNINGGPLTAVVPGLLARNTEGQIVVLS